MDSGTMLIPNYLGEKTTLIILKGKASSLPEDNALLDAKKALRHEKGNRTVSEGNVSFLTEWIKLAEAPQVKEEEVDYFKVPVFNALKPETVQFGKPSWEK